MKIPSLALTEFLCSETRGVSNNIVVSMSCKVCQDKAGLMCSECREAVYCSKECQKEDWKLGHQLICGESTSKDKSTKNTLIEYLDPLYENVLRTKIYLLTFKNLDENQKNRLKIALDSLELTQVEIEKFNLITPVRKSDPEYQDMEKKANIDPGKYNVLALYVPFLSESKQNLEDIEPLVSKDLLLTTIGIRFWLDKSISDLNKFIVKGKK